MFKNSVLGPPAHAWDHGIMPTISDEPSIPGGCLNDPAPKYLWLIFLRSLLLLHVYFRQQAVSTNQHLPKKKRRGSRIGQKEKSNYQVSLMKPSVIGRELGNKNWPLECLPLGPKGWSFTLTSLHYQTKAALVRTELRNIALCSWGGYKRSLSGGGSSLVWLLWPGTRFFLRGISRQCIPVIAGICTSTDFDNVCLVEAWKIELKQEQLVHTYLEIISGGGTSRLLWEDV